MQQKDQQMVLLDTWGNKCHKAFAEQFEYREIAIRVGIRQEEAYGQLWLTDWHTWQCTKLAQASIPTPALPLGHHPAFSPP